MSVKYLTYEDFGAKGDGVTDDMPAIVACHDSANAQGLPVRTNPDATYYIGGKNLTATIKTDVDFSTTKFIIDDRTLENVSAAIFRVVPDSEPFSPEIKTVTRGMKKLDFPHTGNVYVRVYSDSHNVYVRKGPNKNAGSNPSDCFIVDADGNILNDINWDHLSIIEVLAKSADDTPIVIEGGIFTTIANQAVAKYTYHSRNIVVSRSNVTVRGLTHLITGELDHGAPYAGFITATECWNFTAENLLLTPHFTYYTESKIPGQMVGMGTYDLSLGAAINVKLLGIKQTISITQMEYWGIMGSNHSKEVLLENCEMSRFDAHCGVNNLIARNCRFGKSGFNLIGFGKCLIENTTVKAAAFITFRSDYGSFFNGDITIRNCTWEPLSPSKASVVLSANNTGDHDFGYECMIARNMIIDGFAIKDNGADKSTKLYLFPNYDANFAPDKPYAYGAPATVTVSGLSVESGRELEMYANAEQYSKTEIIYK